MNKETFLILVPHVERNAEPNFDDRVYSKRIMLENYNYDYSHAIVEYMKECGCIVNKTNHNAFGGFYIYHTSPQKYVCPVEFISRYKGGVHIDTKTKWAILFFFSSIVFFAVVLSICGFQI